MNSALMYGSLESGLIFSLVALGVYFTFRVIDFPDLSVDGTFPLGGAVTAVLLTLSLNPLLATLLSVIAGFIAGLMTGYLHVRLKLSGLLSGILTMTALYSINLRIMGMPNMAIFNEATLFSGELNALLILGLIVCVVLLGLNLLLTSQFGLGIRSIGKSPIFARTYGVNVEKMTLFAIANSNALVALAGSLFAQTQGFADISSGTGIIIIGIASVIIGEGFVFSRKMVFILAGCIAGAILYRFIIGLILNYGAFGLESSDLNLISSLLVVGMLMLPRLQKRFFARSKA